MKSNDPLPNPIECRWSEVLPLTTNFWALVFKLAYVNVRSSFGMTNTSYIERHFGIIYPSRLFFSSARMPSTNTLYGLGPRRHALISLMVLSGGEWRGG